MPTASPAQRTPMPRAQLEARAIQRAHERHIHVLRVAGRPGVYQVKSQSEPGTKHIVVDHDGTQACDCRGFYYRQSCCHVEALRSRLAREARRQPVQVQPVAEDAVGRVNRLLYSYS